MAENTWIVINDDVALCCCLFNTCLHQICADCKYWLWKYITNLHYISLEAQNLISVLVCIFGRSVPDGLGGDCRDEAISTGMKPMPFNIFFFLLSNFALKLPDLQSSGT